MIPSQVSSSANSKMPTARRWSFIEKTLVVSVEQLDAHSVYPQRGMTACKIVQRFPDAGREVIRINTVESVEGVTQFDVLPESLVE
jgi:putative N-acetylmannosamine-6-phosphate epimerase